MKKDELQLKYPKAKLNYEPLVNCRRCKGTGEREPKILPSGTRLNRAPCICVFIQHDMIEIVAEGLKRVATQELKKLRE